MKSVSSKILSRTSVRKSAVAVAGLLALGVSGTSGVALAAAPDRAAQPAVADGGGQGAHHRASPQQITSPWSRFTCFSNLLEHGNGWNLDSGAAAEGKHAPRADVLPTSVSPHAGRQAQAPAHPGADLNRAAGLAHHPHGSLCAAGSFWQSHFWY